MFSASNDNEDGDDPYGFDIDFSAKISKKSSYGKGNKGNKGKMMDFSDDESEDEDDPAKNFKGEMKGLVR